MSLLGFIAACCLCAPGPAGTLAFLQSTEQEDQQVCLINLVTRAVTPLGPGQRDGAPQWAPDGQWLAFETSAEGGLRICLTRADGSETLYPEHAAEWNRWPRWAPGGKKLFYASGDGFEAKAAVFSLEDRTETIWGGGGTGVLQADWWGPTNLLAVVVSGKRGLRRREPFSIDSVHLAIVSESSVGSLPEGAMPSKTGDYVEWNPVVAPKGKGLAFESNDGGDREIFVTTLDKGAACVSNHREADWNPVWSPDGEWLAFESFRGGRRGVYRVFPSTARVLDVAASPDYDNWAPAWSPDGQWLAFVSNRTGDPEVFVTNLSGDTVIQVTNRPGPDLAPAWRPEPSP